MEVNFDDLKNTIDKLVKEYNSVISKKEEQIVVAKVKENANAVGKDEEIPTFTYERFLYRLFTNYGDCDNEVCFYQWYTPIQLCLNVGDYIESEFISEAEGKWHIVNITYDIAPYLRNFEPDPQVTVMVDIEVEFVLY